MMIWPWPPMLNRPAWNASPTDSPPRISGVALTSVSEVGPKMPDRGPFVAVSGWMLAPRNPAYAPAPPARAPAENVSHGYEKKYFDAAWVSGSASAISTAP